MKKIPLIFCIIFVFIIYFVPISQAIFEKATGKRIQCFDLIEDTFVTPIERVKNINKIIERIKNRLDTLSTEISSASSDSLENWDTQKAQSLTDETIFDCAELKKIVSNFNRHVKAKSTSKQIKEVEEYTNLFSNLLTALRNQDKNKAGELISSINSYTNSLLIKYKKPNFINKTVLIVKNLPVIFWDAKYLRPYEKELENTSQYTNLSRPVMFFVRYALFKDLGEKGVHGRNNWFYYNQDVDYLIKPYIFDKRSIIIDQNGNVISDNPVKTALHFKNELAKFGVDLLVVIIPGKPSIYPDMLSKKANPERVVKEGHSLKLINELKAAGIDAVDLFSAFLEERKNDSVFGDSMYLAKDTHWKKRGVITAARVVAEKVKQYPWYEEGSEEYILDSVYIDRVGDIGVMTRLHSFKVHDLNMSFPAERVLCYQVYSIKKDDKGNIIEKYLYKDDPKKSKIVLLGDSYSRIYQTDEPRGAGWIAHLAYNLKQPLASIVSDGGASTLVRETLARKTGLLKGKKLVIWEVVERDFRYGNEGWKNVTLELASKQ
jgi:hypothetical protein